MIQHLVEKNTPFSIDALLGHGAQGFVCRAIDANGRTVALKIIRDGALAGEEDRQRFMAEVKNHASLKHPNIVRVLESGRSDGVDWFTMDYIEGTPLSRWKGPRGELDMIKAVCRAVSYAHQQGVIHRDLKPSNIIIDAQGQPHVVDFGLSRRCDGTESLTRAGSSVGTLAYADPECILGKKANEKSDIYGLGMILYEWVTDGSYPYAIDRGDPQIGAFIPFNTIVPPRDRTVQVAPDLDTIIRKCLHPSPNRRYNSAEDLLADIECYQRGEPIKAKPRELRYVGRLWLRKHKRTIMGITALMIPVLTVVGILAQQASHQRAQHAEAERKVRTLEDFRADIGSKMDSITSAQLAELAAMNHPDPRRLQLPALGSSWFLDFNGNLQEAVETINTHRFFMEVDRSREWLRSERPIGIKEAGDLGAAIVQQVQNLEDPQALIYLSAARSLALDISTGTMMPHKAGALVLRREIYQTLNRFLDGTQMSRSMRGFLQEDPPLCGYAGAMLFEEMKISQVVEYSALRTGVIDYSRLNELVGASFKTLDQKTAPRQDQVLALASEIFMEYGSWDDVPADQALSAYTQKRNEWSKRAGWQVLSRLIPSLHKTLMPREEISKLRDEVISMASN